MTRQKKMAELVGWVEPNTKSKAGMATKSKAGMATKIKALFLFFSSLNSLHHGSLFAINSVRDFLYNFINLKLSTNSSSSWTELYL